MGVIDQVVRGRDGIIRRVIVRFRNFKEDFDRFTDRSAKKLIKIYSAEDPDLQHDLTRVQARIDELLGGGGQQDATAIMMEIFSTASREGDVQFFSLTKSPILQGKCQCCCKAHCMMSFHNYYRTKTFCQAIPSVEDQGITMINMKEEYEADSEEIEEVNAMDNFTTLIMSVGVDLN